MILINKAFVVMYCVNTGVGLYHSTYGLLANNSVVLARNGLLEGSFFCLSGRLQPGIGQWISPSGNDYTLPGTHAFNVTVGGERNPGVVEISVSGSDHRFPAGLWDGVYSCLIPNEAGVEQIIYVGIYIVVFGKFIIIITSRYVLGCTCSLA